MKKETFIECINAIQEQCKLNIEVSKHLNNAFPDAFQANLLPKNDIVQNALIKALEEAMCDKGEWIEYFCWELNFGAESFRLNATHSGKIIPLNTPEDLFNYLTSTYSPI